ncbi:MAG: hypothetical protein JJU36_01370 [Phycisphaeraceae bacterium]|nr:hypothetical protein [Phycisphaeraceae bacterium]
MMRYARITSLTVCLVVAAGASSILGGKPAGAPEPVTVVTYDFNHADDRAAPSTAHRRVEAGRFMQPGFFPPPDRYFDGSLGGEAGEAIVDRDRPSYYDFTVEGLAAFERLDTLTFTVTTRQSHAAAGHVVSVTMFKGEDETEHPLRFDVFETANESAEPEAADAESFFLGGHVGNARRIVVALSGIDHADRHTFRIHFDRPRMRSRTALDDVVLKALPGPDGR